MQNIASFFKKFSNIKLTSRVVKAEVLNILNNRHIPITKDEIVYNNGIVYIKGNQIVKNEVFFLREDILKDIENKLGKKMVIDIR